MSGGKEYRIISRVKNNLLMEAIEAAGIESVAELSRRSGVGLQSLHNYINFKASSVHAQTGAWKDTVLKVCDYLGVTPDEVFSVNIDRIAKTSYSVSKVSEDELALALLPSESPETVLAIEGAGGAIERALSSLPPRIAFVVKKRYGLDGDGSHTLDETANLLAELEGKKSLGRERIRQMESRGLMALRNPSRSCELAPHMETIKEARKDDDFNFQLATEGDLNEFN